MKKYQSWLWTDLYHEQTTTTTRKAEIYYTKCVHETKNGLFEFSRGDFTLIAKFKKD